MAIYNVGSINLDTIFRVPHLPRPGETIAAGSVARSLGGKGANQSVAIARAGGTVRHIGAVGGDGRALLQEMAEHGVDIGHVAVIDDAMTGQAFIQVDDAGENIIVVDAGTNGMIGRDTVERALATASAADTLVLQNETNDTAAFAEMGRARGMRIVWSAAPFDVEAAREMLPLIDLLVLNETEMQQLEGSGLDIARLETIERLVTAGSAGSTYFARDAEPLHMQAMNVEAVDTTGAGDTYLGTFLAAQDAGANHHDAMARAAATAALHVTRTGAASSTPSRREVDAWLAERGCDR